MKGECGICEYWAGDATDSSLAGQCERTEDPRWSKNYFQWCGEFRADVEKVLVAVLGIAKGTKVAAEWEINGVAHVVDIDHGKPGQ